jgi:hypothetical protein
VILSSLVNLLYYRADRPDSGCPNALQNWADTVVKFRTLEKTHNFAVKFCKSYAQRADPQEVTGSQHLAGRAKVLMAVSIQKIGKYPEIARRFQKPGASAHATPRQANIGFK